MVRSVVSLPREREIHRPLLRIGALFRRQLSQTGHVRQEHAASNWDLYCTIHRLIVECSTAIPRTRISASTWRVLNGYAPYHRPHVTRISWGTCAPWKRTLRVNWLRVLGYYRVFNLILWVLYTGMQWKCLPIPHDAQGNPALHCTTVYKVFARWAYDGSLWQAFIASVRHLVTTKHLDVRVLHGDGTTTVAKKGRWHWLFALQTSEGGESHRDHGQLGRRLSACPRGSRQCNRYGAVAQGAACLEAGGETG
jgi:transposase